MVLARETTLQELLEGSKQYQIPLYQRTYSWETAQLKQLWEDITQLAEDRAHDRELTHFIGSVVLTPSPGNGPTGVQEFLVIDGQQRLTTLSILLCALRDHRAATEGKEHRERVDEQYLINKWRPGQQRLKLVPTQADRAAYLACLDFTPQAGGTDRIGAAYRFFSARLVSADDPDDPHDVERIEDAVISGLALVSVTAQQGDNPHRIFESLNNTGLRLTQADLLRNYLFMRLPTRGEAVYESLWLPLQNTLDRGQLELLFWLDLVQRDPRAKQADTYTGQQRRLDRMRSEEEVEREVARFGRLGQLLRTILDPSREPDPAVRHRLTRLGEWGTTTVYPVLLHLLDRRVGGTADSAQIATAMRYLESYFVRRLLIGRPTAGINRTLLTMVTEMDSEAPVDHAVRRYLATGRKHYASDREIRAAVRSMPYYLNGRPNHRTLVLRWLEETYGSKEPVDLSSLTIEHVLPQTPTPEWRQVLAEDLEAREELGQVHEALVHTLGNLTLTGYNATLGNSPFEVKRPKLAGSGVLMSQEIAKQERWGRSQILERADALAERVIGEWPAPATHGGDSSGVPWGVMNRALAELPAGSWTTYGDLAALIGSHPVSIGQRLATTPAPNAHRVLQSDGKVSPNFAWLDPAQTDDPRDLLEAEGVTIDHHGRAARTQRVTTEGLAVLIGADVPDLVPELGPGQDPAARDRFLDQLAEQHGHDIAKAVITVLDAWTHCGGHLAYGAEQETSCFLMSRGKSHPDGNIWPATVYPSGKFEIVFQHLRRRPPFDGLARREELRQRLNGVDGVDLPAAKIDQRPGFDLGVLLSPAAREQVIAVLGWFHSVAGNGPSAGDDVS
ncbi:GmrSD restriction endonuclease domain-containing protein [Saccharothrix isguenensis]